MNLEQRKAWNANHKFIAGNILKPDQYAQTIELFITNHAFIHLRLEMEVSISLRICF